jgi:ribosomal protein S14
MATRKKTVYAYGLEPKRGHPGLSYDDQRAYQDLQDQPWPIIGKTPPAYPDTDYGREMYRRVRAEQKARDYKNTIARAHEILDDLGVPRGNPPLDDAPLSGRIAYLGEWVAMGRSKRKAVGESDCIRCGRSYNLEDDDLGICCICFRDAAYKRVYGSDWRRKIK